MFLTGTGWLTCLVDTHSIARTRVRWLMLLIAGGDYLERDAQESDSESVRTQI